MLKEADERHAARLDVAGALSSTLGATARCSASCTPPTSAGRPPTTIVTVGLGVVLLAGFVVNQARVEQPLLPLRLLADRRRAGAYGARFLFNGALVSFFFFMTQYLQGVGGFSPRRPGSVPASDRRRDRRRHGHRAPRCVSSHVLAVVGCAGMLVGTAWVSRV